jgi:hypothetical protein
MQVEIKEYLLYQQYIYIQFIIKLKKIPFFGFSKIVFENSNIFNSISFLFLLYDIGRYIGTFDIY